MREMYFDVWPGDDLLGASIGELTDASDKRITVVDNGMGNGQFTINRHSSQYAWVTPGPTVPEPLIRVRRVPGGPFDYDDARYKFAFFVEEGNDALLSPDEEGGEDATRSGRGAEAILSRAIIDFEAHYVDDIVNHPYDKTALADGQWHFTEADPQAFLNVGTPGAVLRILLRNAGAQVPEPIPEVVHTGDINEDTNSVPWPDGDAEWAFDVGTDLLTVLGTLVQSKLYYKMTPALVLNTYATQQGTDLSGSITFTKGNTAGEGISESGDRVIHASPAKSRVLVEGAAANGTRTYRWVDDAAIEAVLGVRQGHLEYPASPTNAILDKAGDKHLTDLMAQHDGPPTLGVDEVAGQEALIDYTVGDTVTVDIPGVYDTDPVRIFSISLIETDTGEVDVALEFAGESWVGVGAGPSGTGTGVPGLLLCKDGGATTIIDSFDRTEASGWGTSNTGHVWNHADGLDADLSVGSGVGVISVTNAPIANESAEIEITEATAILWQAGRFTFNARFKVSSVTADGMAMGFYIRPEGVGVEVGFDTAGQQTLAVSNQVDSATITPPLWVVDTWYILEWRHSDGLDEAKLWKESDPEPVAYQVSISGGTLGLTGDIFQVDIFANSGDVPCVITIDYLSIRNPDATCIVGGPNATSGDPDDECNHKAAPCNHDHAYTSAQVSYGTGTVEDALDALPSDAEVVASAMSADRFKSVRVATTASVTISTALNSGDVIDGVTLATNDRVLVKDQSTASQNGIYIVGPSPARAADFDVGSEVAGTMIFVEAGTVGADTLWYVSTNSPITVGSTSISILQFRTLSNATPATAFQEFGGAGAGTSLNVSRADHQHNAGFFSSLVGTDSAPGDVAAVGTAGSVPRRDHRHGRESYGLVGDIVAEAFGDTASAGALSKVANAAHRHAMPANPVTAHVAAADDHTQYQKESEKGAASGYASLGADTLVPQDQLGTGVQDGTKFLRDDGTWQAVSGSFTPATDPGDIADPTLATAQEVAEKVNELMANMRTAGMLV